MQSSISTPRGCFLGVERSLTGKRWEERLGDSRQALALSQQLGLPEIVGRVLAARGVDLDEAERFLDPTLRAYLPDPSALQDMDRAAARLVRAVEQGEKLAVFGDYDVDGATSAAVLARFFAASVSNWRSTSPTAWPRATVPTPRP
jgi:single-stranded-DNA-specific exonuclease